MKLVNFISNEGMNLGVWTERGIVNLTELSQSIGSLPKTMEQVLNTSNKAVLLEQLKNVSRQQNSFLQEQDIVFAPVVSNPQKILCIGLNYRKHLEEFQKEAAALSPAKHPTVFSKFNNTLAAHRQHIPLQSSAVQYDYEAELVIVIGKEGKNIPKADAGSYIFGYTVGNDLTARDIQSQTSQWLLGKSFDCFAPIGPYLVTADEVEPQNLTITCRVNGRLRQSANTAQMIFDCQTIIHHISQYMTLKPGDIIFSGTPEGVIMGMPKSKQEWLHPGDTVEVTIERIGTLTNVLTND